MNEPRTNNVQADADATPSLQPTALARLWRYGLSQVERPQICMAWMVWVVVALLAFGLYLQHVVGLEPCPMCIVQRYALVLLLITAGLGSRLKGVRLSQLLLGLIAVWGVLGAYVAARQSWLQWYPPEVVSCGRDFYAMVETFPLKRAIPMIFRGGGDCSAVDWTLLGGSIANWSFAAFAGLTLLAMLSLFRSRLTAS